jgi:prevent-host-death family protein
MDRLPPQIGAFDAKTHFSQVLDRVANGETITITRHGKPIARIVPETDAYDQQRHEAARSLKQDFRGALKGVTLDDLLAMRHEGHRY